MKFSQLKGIVESFLFVSEGPLRVEKIHEILEFVSKKDIQKVMDELVQDYKKMDRAFDIVEVAGGYQFRTKPAYSEWIRKLKKPRQIRLGRAALETLAIVAYKQPVVRAEIEKIRGVDSGAVIGGLLKKGLIKIMGRKDLPGRPIVYGTSRRFLEIFGIKDLSSLPTLREIDTVKED